MKRKSARVYRMGRIESKKVRAAKGRVPLFLIAILVVILGVFGSPSAHAVLLTLSNLEGEPATAPYPEDMDATMNFSVASSTLTLTVVNLTSVPALNMNQLYFNTSTGVTALTLDNAVHSVEGSITTEWPLVFNIDGIQVDGFGLYDVSLIDGKGSSSVDVIGPGENIVFTIIINGGIGSFLDSDFIQLSTQVDSHEISYAAAKFYDGGDISDFGATNVPEPTTICMLVLGGLLLRRRKLSNVS